LAGNALNIFSAAFEINVFAGKWLERFELRFGGQITFSPIIDRLAADEDIRLSCHVAYI